MKIVLSFRAGSAYLPLCFSGDKPTYYYSPLSAFSGITTIPGREVLEILLYPSASARPANSRMSPGAPQNEVGAINNTTAICAVNT